MFRAPNLTAASTMYESMLNFSAIFQGLNVPTNWGIGIFLMYLLVLILPNTEQLFHRYRPELADENLERSRTSLARLVWRENSFWAIFLGVMFVIGLVLINGDVKFIYFQF